MRRRLYLNNYLFSFIAILILRFTSNLKRQYNWHGEYKDCCYFSVLRQVYSAYHIIVMRCTLLNTGIVQPHLYNGAQHSFQQITLIK